MVGALYFDREKLFLRFLPLDYSLLAAQSIQCPPQFDSLGLSDINLLSLDT